MRKLAIIFALFTATTGMVSGQQKGEWSLDECIRYALDNNISLKRKALETEISQKDYTQSKLNALPNLNGVVEHNLGAGRVLDRGTYEWVNTDVSQGDLGIGSNLTVFSGLTGWNSIKMQKAAYQMAQAEEEVLENNITLQVMTAYLDVLRRAELYEIAEDKVRVTRLQVDRMQRLLEVGNASQGELLEVNAQYSNEKYNLTLAKNSLEMARLELAQAMNLESATAIQVRRPAVTDPELIEMPDLDTVYERALRVLPRIESATSNIEFNKKNLAVKRGQLSPELFIRGLYYSNYSDKLINPRITADNPELDYPIPVQIRDNQYRQVTLGVNIPIFNKWQNRTEISKARVGLQDAHYQLEDTRQQLMKEIRQYYTDALAARANYDAASETFINSEEAYRYADEKFKVGMATALELEEARNRRYESRAEMISTKYVYLFYVKILDFYQGIGIRLD